MKRQRIAIIGNGGGGKTTLSRSLAQKYQIPVLHVDSIQYLAGMKVRDVAETRQILNQVAEHESWLIDGFGPLDVIEKRFELADLVIFVDFPLWRHYWWCTKRQLKSIWAPRAELPLGCSEATLSHSWRLFNILWRVHFKIRPQLLAMIDRPEIAPKVLKISNLAQWNSLYDQGWPKVEGSSLNP